MAALIVLEALLSADNALVLAIMVRHLPRHLQQKALLYGLGGAFVFRLIAILLAKYVLSFWWLQALGAAYLLFLPFKHFYVHSQKKEVKPVGAGFWQTVIAVEFADIAFAIDSVLAGIAFISKPGVGVMGEKIWVVYLGAMIGLILLRFAAGVFIRILDRYPFFDHVAYILVGWVGVKLAFLAGHSYELGHPGALPFDFPEMPKAVFWTVLVGIAVIGTIIALKNRREPDPEMEAEAEIAADVKDLSVDEPPPPKQ
ncbi:MAG TPA: TerC family protein [Fimbriimonadaceae bacterium]|nr:TerC family protein [Fimbriimonadaceae bacterium]